MPNASGFEALFPYSLDKEDIEYLHKGVQSIFQEFCGMKNLSWNNQCYTHPVKQPLFDKTNELNCTSSEHNYHIESVKYKPESRILNKNTSHEPRILNKSTSHESRMLNKSTSHESSMINKNTTSHESRTMNKNTRPSHESKTLNKNASPCKNEVSSTSQSRSSDKLYSDILQNGIDDEDMAYIKKSFYYAMWDDQDSSWARQLKWIPHATTSDDTIGSLPDYLEETGHLSLNKTGCARTDGYVKRIKKYSKMQAKYKPQEAEPTVNGRVLPYSKTYKGNKQTLSRDARNDQRRLSTAYQTITHSNLLNLNELKFRKKKLKLGKSEIHGLGLFASEPIGPNEIIIEYVGQIIRPIIADLRESGYRQSGLGYYCFLIDDGTVVDATKYGNINRYINHSCNPNSYAKILVINNKKKIVIYSKRHIKVNEEITYDYKMKIEDEKIECLCKAPGCRKSLN